MSKQSWFVKVVGSLGLFAAIAVVAYLLMGTPAATAAPTPDCGPTFTWDCTLPNGSHQTVEGTRCEIAAFKKQTGATCTISG